MSQNIGNLPNDEASAYDYVQKVIRQGWVKAVYIIGSRSPKTSRQPRENSDWDFIFITELENHTIATPRELGVLNACVNVRHTSYEHIPKSATMLYPDRESDVLPEFKKGE